MLQALRDKTSGWIATAILGLLIIPFAFFGLSDYLVTRSESFVAKVEAPPHWWASAPKFWPVSKFWENEEVSVNDFRDAFERARQQQRAQQGEAFDNRAFESKENKLVVLDALIDAAVQRLAARNEGVIVSDALVRKTIAGIPQFQGADGKFSPTTYQTLLATGNPPRTPAQFEEEIRGDLQQRLVTDAIASSNFVTSAEMDRLIKLMGEKRDVSMIILPPPAVDTAPVVDAEIKSWYDSHPKNFVAPESVTVEYVEVNGATLPAPAVDDATLLARYEQEKKRFVAEEQRLASHILIKVAPDADAAAQKAAEQKAAQLATQAKAPGADFAALARANSDDAGSKAGGGDLSWVSKGMMVGPFETALFAMKTAGDISAPVKSDFGWHVIQLREIKGGVQESFEQAREALAREQAESGRERAFNDLSSKLVDAVLKNPSALAPAAAELKLPVNKLGPFSRGSNEGIAAHPAVKRAAFSDTLVQDGTVSDPIELGPNHAVLIRVIAHTPERTQPLAQVREQAIAQLRADRAKKAGEAEAVALLARLRGGETLEAVATSKQMPAPERVAALPRGMPVPGPEAAEAIFATPAPAEGKTSPGKAILADGRIVLFALHKVNPGNLTEITPPQRTGMQQQVAQATGELERRALVSALRKRMQVKIEELNL